MEGDGGHGDGCCVQMGWSKLCCSIGLQTCGPNGCCEGCGCFRCCWWEHDGWGRCTGTREEVDEGPRVVDKGKQPKTEQPKTEEPKAAQPGTDQTPTEQPRVDETQTEQPRTNQTPTEQTLAEQPQIMETWVEHLRSGYTPTEQTPTEQPHTEQPHTEQPQTDGGVLGWFRVHGSYLQCALRFR